MSASTAASWPGRPRKARTEIPRSHAFRDVLSFAGLRLEPRKRSLPARRGERAAGARSRGDRVRARGFLEPAAAARVARSGPDRGVRGLLSDVTWPDLRP